MKFQSSRSAVIINTIIANIAIICGWVLTLFFAIGFFAILFPENGVKDTGAIIICLIFIAIGVYFIMLGTKRKRLIKRFKGYVSIISIDNETFIENIGAKTSQSTDFVMNDIQNMIDKKLFINASIDKNRGYIVFQNMNNNLKTESSESDYSNNEVEVVICSGCGAKNTILKGSNGECEFCGSPIVSE